MKNIAKISMASAALVLSMGVALAVAPVGFGGAKVALAQKADTGSTGPTLGGVYYPPQLPPVQTHPPRSPITGR